MTLNLNNVLEVVKIHVRAKFHRAKCSGSWDIVIPEKKNFKTQNIWAIFLQSYFCLRLQPLPYASIYAPVNFRSFEASDASAAVLGSDSISFHLLQICCTTRSTTSCTTSPQQVEMMESEPYSRMFLVPHHQRKPPRLKRPLLSLIIRFYSILRLVLPSSSAFVGSLVQPIRSHQRTRSLCVAHLLCTISGFSANNQQIDVIWWTRSTLLKENASLWLSTYVNSKVTSGQGGSPLNFRLWENVRKLFSCRKSCA